MKDKEQDDEWLISNVMYPAFKTIETLVPESSQGRVAYLVLQGCGRVIAPLVQRVEELERRVQDLSAEVERLKAA